MQPGAVAVGIYGFRMKGRASSCSAGRQARLAGWQLPHMGTYSWLGVEKATKSAVWLSHTHTHTHTELCVCAAQPKFRLGWLIGHRIGGV